MKTSAWFIDFILDNYEMLAAVAWGGYKYTRQRGFVMVTTHKRESEPYTAFSYLAMRDIAEGMVDSATLVYLTEKTAIYDPQKGLVVLINYPDDVWANRCERSDITPPEAYRKHQAIIDQFVAPHAGQFPTLGARLN